MFLVGLLIRIPHICLTQPNPFGRMHVHENILLSPWLWWWPPVEHTVQVGLFRVLLWDFMYGTALEGLGNMIEPYRHSPASPHGRILSVVEWTVTILREKWLERRAGHGVGRNEWINKSNDPKSLESLWQALHHPPVLESMNSLSPSFLLWSEFSFCHLWL